MPDRVHCRAEFTYPERPTHFEVAGEPHTVQTILKEWHSPEGKGFWVHTESGENYQLLYDAVQQTWDVQKVDLSKERR
jgi:hypothetical protein